MTGGFTGLPLHDGLVHVAGEPVPAPPAHGWQRRPGDTGRELGRRGPDERMAQHGPGNGS